MAFGGIFYYLSVTSPTSFVPSEDTGSIMADIALPPSASIERTEQIISQVENIARTIPEIQNILRVSGRGMISGSGSNYGMVIIRLRPWSERKEAHQSVQAIIGQLFAKTAGIREAKVIFFALLPSKVLVLLQVLSSNYRTVADMKLPISAK